MQFLDLDDDCLVALINCVRPENLVNLVLGCRRLYELPATRLVMYREYIAKYSFIGFYYQNYDNEPERQTCDFGQPTLHRQHPIDLLVAIEKDSHIASYVKSLYYDKWKDFFANHEFNGPPAAPHPMLEGCSKETNSRAFSIAIPKELERCMRTEAQTNELVRGIRTPQNGRYPGSDPTQDRC